LSKETAFGDTALAACDSGRGCSQRKYKVPSLTALPADGLSGRVRVPGDKSISHRAIMFGGLAVGETVIDGLLEGEDVLRTADLLRALGAKVRRDDATARWHVHGMGVGGFHEPNDIVDMGNAGTGVRLAMGLVATHPFTTIFTGDASLRRRPMSRVTAPLRQMGAEFYGRANGLLPIATLGTAEPLPIQYRLPVASAQVKSAVLLAGLNTQGETSVIEPVATRDHTELMLRHFGADVRVTQDSDGANVITLVGLPELRAAPVSVPADPSSAAFLVVAACIVPGSDMSVEGVSLNPHRTGLYKTLQEMGADLRFQNQRHEAGEAVADIVVKAGTLTGVEVPAERAPSMIDEYPILAVAAACAKGKTIMHGLEELRVKESDRLAAVADGLSRNGVTVHVDGDTLIVEGQGSAGARPKGDGEVITHLDHRIAMAFLVLGMASENGVKVDDDAPIATSFPGFVGMFETLGATFS